MIKDGNARYNPKTARRDDSSQSDVKIAASQSALAGNPGLEVLRKTHRVVERSEKLAAKQLAALVGGFYFSRFSPPRISTSLPWRAFTAGQPIHCNNTLYWIKRGSVVIRHSRHKYMVTSMQAGNMFGDMPLLGQTMLVTEAVAGNDGATVAIMNVAAAEEWIASDPSVIARTLGPKLTALASDYFGSQFQLRDCRVAALLLKLAGEGTVIDGLTQDALGDKMGFYRETINLVMNELQSHGLIEIRRKKITILDKEALRELSEL